MAGETTGKQVSAGNLPLLEGRRQFASALTIWQAASDLVFDDRPGRFTKTPVTLVRMALELEDEPPMTSEKPSNLDSLKWLMKLVGWSITLPLARALQRSFVSELCHRMQLGEFRSVGWTVEGEITGTWLVIPAEHWAGKLDARQSTISAGRWSYEEVRVLPPSVVLPPQLSDLAGDQGKVEHLRPETRARQTAINAAIKTLAAESQWHALSHKKKRAKIAEHFRNENKADLAEWVTEMSDTNFRLYISRS